MKKISIKIELHPLEELHCMLGIAMEDIHTVASLEDKMLQAAWLELMIKVKHKLLFGQAKYTIALTPTQAMALAILSTYSYTDMYHRYLATKLQSMLPTTCFTLSKGLIA